MSTTPAEYPMRRLTEMTSLAANGKINRREFIQLALAAGVTVTTAESMFADALAAMPKRGGSARFGLPHGSTTDTLDPAAFPDTGTQVPFYGAMANALTEVDWQGNVTPDLVESMEPDDGAKTWVFKLLKGVTFHDGKNLTPDDIIASFRHHMTADSKSAAKSLLQTVTDIKADGPDTVIFTLSGGNADFPYVCSDYHITIMEAKPDGTADWQNTARTGPFIYESWQPGVRAKLKRNPNYHKPGKPYFDDVTFLTITDVGARTTALTTGEVDWMGRCDLKTLNQLKRQPRIAIDETTGYAHYVLPMLVDQPPFDNNDVRLALKYAINREEIQRKVFFGHAKTGNDNPIAPGVKFAIDPKPKYVYDPAKAKFHLNKAGLSSLKVDLSVANAAFNGAVDAALLYQQHAKAAGIDINVVKEPDDGYWDNVWLKKPWCASYWAGRPSCDLFLSLVYAKGAAWNETHYADPQFNDLLIKARGETDDKKRAVMYAEMQQLLHDNGGVIVLVFNNYVDARSTKLAHGHILPTQEADGFKIAERWWFA
jgi:peptide/nickel transport system substrate-binding protein